MDGISARWVGRGGGGGELSVHCFFYHSTLLLVVYHYKKYKYLLQDAVRHCVGTCVCVCGVHLISVAVLNKLLICSMITLDNIFQTCVTSVRWQKWFTETSQKITVTGQIQGCLYCF